MLKLTLRIRETKEGKIIIEMKQISEKEFLSSTQNEKIATAEIHQAIQTLISQIKEKTKEGE